MWAQIHALHTLQELKALRETREGLDDQIERLQWSLAHDYREPCSPTSSQASSDEGDAEDEAEDGEYEAAILQVGCHSSTYAQRWCTHIHVCPSDNGSSSSARLSSYISV